MIGLTQIKLVAVVAVVAMAFAGGYKIADWRWEARRAAALEQAIAARDAAETNAQRATEKYLAAREQRRIEYREVIREVPTLVDRGECRVTADGLQRLACVLRPADCAAEPDRVLPGSSGPAGAGTGGHGDTGD